MLLTLGIQGLAQTGGRTTGVVVGWGEQMMPYVAPGTRFTAIAAGGMHGLALENDGTVVAWGDNSCGQSAVPAGLSGVEAVAAGFQDSLALKSDGAVVAWGDNSFGQSTVPAGLGVVVAVAAGWYHNLALKGDGTVAAWGLNVSGESTVPTELSGVVAVAAGGYHSLALRSDGTVVAWGDNGSGQSGVPAGLSGVVAVAAGWDHSLALKGDGTVVAWGDNTLGESTVPAALGGVVAVAAGDYQSLALKGDGTVVAWGASQCAVPAGLSGVVAVAAGGYSLALKGDGTVVAWGDDTYGESTVPGGLSGVVAVAAGGYHSLALKGDGTVTAWGFNGSGESTVPTGLGVVVAVAAGWDYSLALKSDGTVVAWGDNSCGQSAVPAGLSGIEAVAAGFQDSLALKSDGAVVAWGDNSFGQSTVPTGLGGVVAVAAGWYHNLALKGDGTVVAWGDDSYGESTVPAGLSGVVAVAAGGYHSLALKGDGTVAAWGFNGSGESTVPTGLGGVVGVAAGQYHSLALKSDGTVVAWGDSQCAVPAGLSGVVAVAAGGHDSLAVVACAPSLGNLSNVRASQRAGTTLVDLFYDLSGKGSVYTASVAVSSDAGASFTVPATHLAGDGVTSPTLPGSGLHIVWDAGADFPGQFSTRMRLQLVVNGTDSAVSPIFTLDTRAAVTGALRGHVQGDGGPVVNAQVRIQGTAFSVSTDSSGAFALNDVPAGSGHVVSVAAAGFASMQVPGVTVSAGTTDMGTITLAGVSGPCRLVALAPDVNPSMTTVEVGGTAYRYYLALNSANQPQGGVTVSVQVAGGNPIPQSGDVSAYWPGQTAGVSDADGVVRVSIPASALGALGVAQTVELSLAGQVQQTFQAEVVLRQYDQTWTQKLGGGVSVGDLLSAEADTSGGSEVRHTLRNGAVVGECISRTWQEKLEAGPGFDVGSSLSVTLSPGVGGAGGASASAGAGVSAAVTLRSTFGFDPRTTDPGQNAMKLYVDLGNVLSGLPGPDVFYQFVETTLEPAFLDSNLQAIEGDVQAGLYAEGEGTLELGLLSGQRQVQVGIDGSVSADADAIAGYAATFGAGNETASVVGSQASASANLSAQAQASLGSGDPASQVGGACTLLNSGLAAKQLLKKWTRQGESASYRSERINQVVVQAGQQIPVAAWTRYDPGDPGDPGALYQNYPRQFTETVEMTNAVPLTGYSWSVSSYQPQTELDANLDLGSFGVNLQGELDQGAEVVNERGVFWQSRYWPAESYPAITTSLFPTESWFSLLSEWGANAAGPIGQAIQAAATTVENAANTVVQVAAQGYHGVLNIASGAMAAGSQVYASVSAGVSGLLGGPRPLRVGTPRGGGPRPDVDYGNYIYGIGGIYQFTSSNAFGGTAILTISYTDAEVAGLNPADLRIYQLPAGTNGWQLVGGTVDTVSNTVSVVVTNLGTYAVAPPLPTGDMQLVLSTNALPADGVSQLTVLVTNLMLNTGNVATQQWFFTASADGVQILNQDCDTNIAGIQVVSTNGAVTLLLQAPSGGTVAHVNLSSVAGDAYGSAEINLIDSTPPATPTNVVVTAGQSRIWVSWQTNREPDVAGYRVYYRMGAPGPPWDGSAAVEGTPSPVMVTGTNCLLRGLSLGTNYFVAVSAVDTTGNESPLSPPQEVTTSQAAPAPPTSVAVRFGQDGTNILMWALSEDDGYNDRDVAYYEVWRAVLPGGSYVEAGEVPAGVGVFCDTNVVVAPGQYVSYAVTAVASSGTSSSPASALILIAAPTMTEPTILADGSVQFNLSGVAGLSYTVQASTNLVDWVPILSFVSTSGTTTVADPAAAKLSYRFYRASSP
jgi:alpha-tubulin suppressor-like RCC1 family protein